MPTPHLAKFAWLSIFAALITISLKASAYWLTGSVGLLSDALESVVNLVAAIVALIAISVATRPPDDDHAYGHSKAEYFSSGVEGTLIVLAALSIIVASLHRLFNPQPVDRIEIGVVISLLASLVNFGVAQILFKIGRTYRSITLEADAKHLMTDVWTSVGVVVGVAIVVLTQYYWLDAVVAMLVAVHILAEGQKLVRRSLMGLMDTSLPTEEVARIEAILAKFAPRGIETHALRSRQAGARRFVSVHVLVPDDWTVRQGHDVLEEIEAAVQQEFTLLSVFTHLEPLSDPASWNDVDLDRHFD